MNPELLPQIKAIHAATTPLVVAITGGGTSAIAELLAIPGGSQVLIEGVVPYHELALAEWLGGRPSSACSGPTASAMAMASYLRGRELMSHDQVAGIGLTASLVSVRPKRGNHRIHAAWQTRQSSGVLTLALEKGRRDRVEEELVATQLALMAMAAGSGAPNTLAPLLAEAEHIERVIVHAPQSWQGLVAGDKVMKPVGFDPHQRPIALFPGAFHPLHDGHRAMARVARQKLGLQVVWELSIANVDKPLLDFIAITERTSQFGPDPYLLTRSPTFVEKGRLVPGAVFVVGADTIERVGAVRYYGGRVEQRDEVLAELAQLGCRFLVFGRQWEGRFQGLEDLDLPPKLRDLCDGVTEEEFRHDISSTVIRQQQVD